MGLVEAYTDLPRNQHWLKSKLSQPDNGWHYSVFFSVSATFLWEYFLVQRFDTSQTLSMLWLWAFFFFPDFTQIVKLCWKMTFPKNGDDSSGRKSSLLAKDSSSLVRMHHWRSEPALHATKQKMNFHNVIGFKHIAWKEEWWSGSWVWPQPAGA